MNSVKNCPGHENNPSSYAPENGDGGGTPFVSRMMEEYDLPELMKLKSIAKWNQLESDWRLFISSNPSGCFIVECERKLAGTVTSINYGDIISWIGMVLVSPDFRRMGIATRLMEMAIESLSGCASMKLDATPEGKKVYDKLGFVDEFGLRRMVSSKGLKISSSDSPRVTAVGEADIKTLSELDAAAFGASRESLLRHLAARKPEMAFKISSDGRTSGFCLGRDGENFDQIGPVVAESAEDAVLLSDAAIRTCRGRPVTLDVPDSQSSWLSELVAMGFSAQRSFVRMRRGEEIPVSRPRSLYAIAGPELG